MKSAWAKALIVGAVFGSAASARAQLIYTTISDPLGVEGTYCEGISGNTIVGYYQDASGESHGFSYNGITFTTLDVPGAGGSLGTRASGISGGTIVGTYQTPAGAIQGFTYQNGTFTTINDPSATVGSTSINGVSGTTLVGSYTDSSGQGHGFVDNNGVFSNLNDPAASASSQEGTVAEGVYVNTIVGDVFTNSGAQAFIYNGASYANFVAPTQTSPVVVSPTGISAHGVSGNDVVGAYEADVYNNGIGQFPTGDEFGYVYDGTTFTTLDDPLAANEFGYGTDAEGIDGNNVVGFYMLNYDTAEGFEVTVPEPAIGIVALACGATLLRQRRQRRGCIAVAAVA